MSKENVNLYRITNKEREVMEIQAGTDRKKQVPDQLERLSYELSELEHLVEDIAEKLQPVITNKPSLDRVGEPKKEKDFICDVANGIRTSKLRIEEMNAKLKKLINSLEI
jgi:hypothetical protein